MPHPGRFFMGAGMPPDEKNRRRIFPDLTLPIGRRELGERAIR